MVLEGYRTLSSVCLRNNVGLKEERLAWGLPRALRFALRVPVCFRAKGQNEWRQGRTENMSRSGVLFTSDETLRTQEDVEMVFVLPVAAEDESTVVIACEGRVVRADVSFHTGRMAAAFLSYRFLRPAAVEEA